MQTTFTTPVITVTATDQASRDLKLNAAVAAIREQALADGQRGILVTRHAPGKFTIELSHAVPFGTTRERDSTPD